MIHGNPRHPAKIPGPAHAQAPPAPALHPTPRGNRKSAPPGRDQQQVPPDGAHKQYSIIYSYWVGGNLLSHTLPSAVPSARAGLASGFGKGPGVSPPPSTTDTPKKACTTLTNAANICNYLATVSQPTTTHHVVAILVCFVSDCTVDASTNSLMLLRNAVLPTNNHLVCWCLSAN